MVLECVESPPPGRPTRPRGAGTEGALYSSNAAAILHTDGAVHDREAEIRSVYSLFHNDRGRQNRSALFRIEDLIAPRMPLAEPCQVRGVREPDELGTHRAFVSLLCLRAI